MSIHTPLQATAAVYTNTGYDGLASCPCYHNKRHMRIYDVSVDDGGLRCTDAVVCNRKYSYNDIIPLHLNYAFRSCLGQ